MTDASSRAEGRRLLSGAERVLVLTGAGVSADSGVPTFRGEEGLWKDHRPEELATPEAFRRDPRLVWEWYAWRRELVSGFEPNAAHRALARWSLRSSGVWIATQNVDGLHHEALRTARSGSGPRARARSGGPSGPPAEERLLELHGSLFRVRCVDCGVRSAHRGEIDASSVASLPRCGECGSMLRPDVVWFGESLGPETLRAAREAAAAADVCLVVGTSGVVEPAASLARTAARSGAGVVEVNPAGTVLSRLADAAVRAGAAEAVPPLVDEA